MLSILIPIHNYNSTDLVKALHRQGEKDKLEFEIICLDDASSEEYRKSNRELGTLSNVHYEELAVNVGRAKIRNLLAEKARYDSLLFIDCDMAITREDFLSKYANGLKESKVVIGGMKYQAEVPGDPELLLRWTYGKERESISLEERLKNPYTSFMTGAFAIDKSVFLKIKFDETIKRYGHEDTLFGKELYTHHIEVTHLDNPIVHQGLEANTDFISKTEQAIETLAELAKADKLQDEVRLYKMYRKLKRFYLHNLFARRFQNRKDYWLKKIMSSNPDLKYFDMYRLGYLCQLMQK